MMNSSGAYALNLQNLGLQGTWSVKFQFNTFCIEFKVLFSTYSNFSHFWRFFLKISQFLWKFQSWKIYSHTSIKMFSFQGQHFQFQKYQVSWKSDDAFSRKLDIENFQYHKCLKYSKLIFLKNLLTEFYQKGLISKRKISSLRLPNFIKIWRRISEKFQD